MNKTEEWFTEFHNVNTRHQKRLALTKFFKWYKGTVEDFARLEPNEIKHLILKWISEMMDAGTPNNSVVGYASSLKLFAEYLGKNISFKRGQIPPHTPDVDSHVFSNGDLATIFNSADVRDKAILSTAVSLGWEIDSFMKIDRTLVENLIKRAEEQKEQFIYFETLRQKTKQKRLAVLNPLAIECLKKWFSIYSGPGCWDIKTFRGMNKRLKTITRRSGITTTGRVHFHKIRGWVYTSLLKGGFSSEEAKYVLGKCIPLSDSTYLDLTENIKIKYPRAYELYLNIRPTHIIQVVDQDLKAKVAALERENTELKLKGQGMDDMKGKLAELAGMVFVLAGEHGDMKEKIVKYLSDPERKRLEKVVKTQDEE